MASRDGGYKGGRDTTDRLHGIIDEKNAVITNLQNNSEKMKFVLNDLLHSITEDRPELVLKYLEYMKIDKR